MFTAQEDGKSAELFDVESVKVSKVVTLKSCSDFNSETFSEDDSDFSSITDVSSQMKCKKQAFNSIQKHKKSKHNVITKQKTFVKDKKQVKKTQNCSDFKIMNQHCCEVHKESDKEAYC